MAKAKLGRPEIELTPEQIDQIEHLSATLTTEDIADYFGIGRTTFYRLMERNSDILERYKKGRTKVKSLIAGRLIQKATEGDTASQIFYLKTQCGWKETQSLEHFSPDGSMTPTKIERVIIDKSTDSNS